MIDLIFIALIHSWRSLALFNLYHCSTCLISFIPANLKAYDFSPISNLISDEGLDAAITFTDSYLLQSRLTSNHRRALMDRFASEVDWIMERDWNDPVEKQGWIDGLVARMIYMLVSTPEYSVQR